MSKGAREVEFSSAARQFKLACPNVNVYCFNTDGRREGE